MSTQSWTFARRLSLTVTLVVFLSTSRSTGLATLVAQTAPITCQSETASNSGTAATKDTLASTTIGIGFIPSITGGVGISGAAAPGGVRGEIDATSQRAMPSLSRSC